MLASYQAMRDPDNNTAKGVTTLQAGMSTLSQQWATNAIENDMRNYRGQTARVTGWRAETNQISRWSATALLHLETGFRRIKGHADLPKLLHALALTSVPSGAGGAAPLQTSPSNIALVQTTSP